MRQKVLRPAANRPQRPELVTDPAPADRPAWSGYSPKPAGCCGRGQPGPVGLVGAGLRPSPLGRCRVV